MAQSNLMEAIRSWSCRSCQAKSGVLCSLMSPSDAQSHPTPLGQLYFPIRQQFTSSIFYPSRNFDKSWRKRWEEHHASHKYALNMQRILKTAEYVHCLKTTTALNTILFLQYSTRPGCNTDAAISLWTPEGRLGLTQDPLRQISLWLRIPFNIHSTPNMNEIYNEITVGSQHA